MAYELTKNNIKIFNQTYGTSISFSQIMSEAKRLNSFNSALMVAFHDAYTQGALKDLIKRDGDVLLSHEMFKDFNRLITDTIIKETPKSQRIDLSKNMGIGSRNMAYNMMEAIWKELPQNQVDVVAENYLRGNIRIRDMVAFSKTAAVFGGKRSKTEIASYAAALKKVNEGRSFWWKVFHPFRNHAEQRDAKIIADMIKTSHERFADPIFAQASSTLINFNDLEKEAIDNVLNNQNLLEEEIHLDTFEQQLKEEFQDKLERGLIFDEDANVDEKDVEIAFQSYKARRIQEREDDEIYKKQQEMKEWIESTNKLNKDDAPEGEEEVKENLPVDNLKEDPYANNKDNEKINDSPVINNPSISKSN